MNRHPALLTCLLTALLATPALATWEEGVAALNAGRLDEAASVFQSFASRSPEAPQGHYMLGVTRLKQKRFSDALGSLSKALEIKPSEASYRMTLANAQYKAGQADDALGTLKDLDAAAVTKASRPNYYRLLSNIVQSSQHANAALAAVDRALAADRSSKMLWETRAKLAKKFDRPEDEFSAWATVYQLDPKDQAKGYRAAYQAITIAQDDRNDKDRKLEWYGKAADLAGPLAKAFPTAKNQRLAGSANMGAARYEIALAYFEKLKSQSSEDPFLHFDLGRCRHALKQYREALDHYSVALGKSPDARLTTDIYRQRGAALQALEEFSDAAVAFRQAGDDKSAEEMEGYAKNREEWAAAKADCMEKKDGLETLMANSEGLEHTPEYRQLKHDLNATLSVCEPYINDQG